MGINLTEWSTSLSDIDERIILASASPRRRQLLSLLGVSFRVVTSDADESVQPGESPIVLAQRLSAAKAEAVAKAHSGAVVIAADTMVVLDGEILGKPADECMAFEMLSRLRAREHLVYSGLALLDAMRGRRLIQVARTPVQMRDYTDAEIRSYVASGDPLDKAGAYAIQYQAFNPVALINGCYANVMGLPICHLYRGLRAWGFRALLHPLRCCPHAVRHGCAWSAGITEAPVETWSEVTD